MRGSRKRGSQDTWWYGRGGLGSHSRNAPGGRGFSGESPPRDGPLTPPPGVGGVRDPPPRNDVTQVHSSGDWFAAGASDVEGSASGKEPWRAKFMRETASSDKKAPTTTHSVSRSGERSGAPLRPSDGDWRVRRASSTQSSPSGEDRIGASPPSWRGQDWWGARDHSRSEEADWRNPSSTPPHPKLSEGSSSGTSPYSSRSDVDSWRKEPESESSGTPSPHWSSSGTPPYHTGRSRSDVDSWRKEADDSPPSSPNITEATGWPQRPVPDRITAMMTPGILGRTPTIVILPAEGEGTTEELVAVLSVAVWEESVEKVWRDAMVKFLNGYKHPGHQSEFYKALLMMLKVLGKFDITVDFNHLKSWDKQLALIICNGQGRNEHWLKEALSLFLNEHGLDSEDASIIFTNMPKSLKKGRDIFCTSEELSSEVTIFNRRERAITSSFFVAQIVDAIISELLARLSFGVSWLGELTMDDIEFTEVNGVLKATITREPVVHQGATGEENILDFYSLWPMIELAVTWRGELALYFRELMNDLFVVTAEEVTEPWFHDYIAHHPSLVASMGRRNVEIGLYQVVSDWYLHKTPELESFFAQIPTAVDWRTSAEYSPHLKLNYMHKNPGATEDSKEDLIKEKATASVATQDGISVQQAKVVGPQQVVADGGCQDAKCFESVSVQQSKTGGQKTISADSPDDASKDSIGKNDKVVSGSSGTPKGLAEQKPNAKLVSGMGKSERKGPLENSRYENTMWGLLEFRRHVYSHPRVWRDDLDESELFLAKVCPDFLCKMLRGLLKKCRMTGKFEPVWSAYKRSKLDPRRLRTPTNISRF